MELDDLAPCLSFATYFMTLDIYLNSLSFHFTFKIGITVMAASQEGGVMCLGDACRTLYAVRKMLCDILGARMELNV